MISVGIDVSKGKSTVCIMKPGGEVLKSPFEISHTLEGVFSLVKTIKSYDEEVRAVMEDTGYYHIPIVTVLVENGIFVCTVNALRMKKFCSQNIRKAKNDRIDSINIAVYGITYWNELTAVMLPSDTYRELKLLARQYYQTTSILIKAKVNFGILCDQVMPNIQDVIYDYKGKMKLSSFVARYIHFENILKLSQKRFKSEYCKWGQKQGYRNCEQTAEKIYAVAKNGIPVLPNCISTTIAVCKFFGIYFSIFLFVNVALIECHNNGNAEF